MEILIEFESHEGEYFKEKFPAKLGTCIDCEGTGNKLLELDKKAECLTCEGKGTKAFVDSKKLSYKQRKIYEIYKKFREIESEFEQQYLESISIEDVFKL